MDATKYTFIQPSPTRHDPNPELVSCDSCQYPAPLFQFDMSTLGRKPGRATVRLLCRICSTSFVSNHTHYTDQYPLVHPITQTIAYCTNAILEQQGAFKEAATILLPADPDE